MGERGREVGEKGEGSGEKGDGSGGKGGGKWGMPTPLSTSSTLFDSIMQNSVSFNIKHLF